MTTVVDGTKGVNRIQDDAVVGGDLVFAGPASRIYGDFTNSDVSKRLLFQTNVANGTTGVGALPNGSAQACGFTLYNSSDPNNASTINLSIGSTGCGVDSGKLGTGAYLPLIFSSGGVERLRLNENGDFKISSTFTLTGVALEVGSSADGTGNRNTYIDLHAQDSVDWNARIIRNGGVDGSFVIANTGAGEFWLDNASANATSMRFRGNTFTNMLINAAGDVEIGKDRAAGTNGRWFTVWNMDPATNANTIIQLVTQANASAAASALTIAKYKHGAATFNCDDPNGWLGLYVASQELFRIQPGALNMNNPTLSFPGVGNTNTGCQIQFTPTGSAIFISRGDNIPIYANSNVDGYLLIARRSGTAVGGVSVTATNTQFNTNSDHRLKQNIRAMAAPLARLLRLKPITFNWRLDDSEGEGFLAHELQEEVPMAVTGEKDAVKLVEDDYIDVPVGTILPQGVDLSKLVPLLVAAVQELAGKLEAANERIAALEEAL